MRFDSVGMFWADSFDRRGKNNVQRILAPVPETNWRPKPFPNLSAAKFLSIDCEAKDTELQDYGPGWARGKSELVGASIATEDGCSWYFPFGHTVEPEYNLPREGCIRFLKDALSDPRQPKLGANLIYDVGTLAAAGIDIKGELVDVQFAEALLDESETVNLDDLGHRYLGLGKESNLLYDWCARSYGGKANDSQRANIWRSPPRLVGPYAESDATLPARILPLQYERLLSENLVDLFRMECALIRLLVQMRFAGVTVDIAKAEQIRERLIIGAEAERQKLHRFAGMQVDINSSQSIARAFDKFGYPYNRTEPTKNYPQGQPSFTQDFLDGCKNPLATSINVIRKLEKLRGTFIESYILESNINGKIFCQFHPLRGDASGTRSGRFSSSDPNLQNIPVRDSEWGPLLRSLFIPDPGHKQWRKYDYSQIEYRMLIHFAVGKGADEARHHFNEKPDTDYHDWALDLIAPHAKWDISTKELRKHWRRPTKNINFGIIFGKGEGSLAEDLGVGQKEAKDILLAYHNGVPFAKPTMDFYMEQVQRHGYIQTLLGRRSRFVLWESAARRKKGVKSPPPVPYNVAIRLWPTIKRAYGYRGLNRVLQGSAADMLKAAMFICMRDGIFDRIGVPRLTVHDELDFSDPGGLDKDFDDMKHVMENAIKLSIPVRADYDAGANWGMI